MVQAVRDFTVSRCRRRLGFVVQVGSRLYSDSTSSYWVVKGYVHKFVHHTRKEYGRGDVHENWAEYLFSLLKLYLWLIRHVLRLQRFVV